MTSSEAGGKEHDDEHNPERVELLLVLNIPRQSQYLKTLFIQPVSGCGFVAAHSPPIKIGGH